MNGRKPLSEQALRWKKRRQAECNEIVQRYRNKGLRKAELREAITRHATVIGANDPRLAKMLLSTSLRGSEIPLSQSVE